MYRKHKKKGKKNGFSKGVDTTLFEEQLKKEQIIIIKTFKK